jgi:hypothetical protein
MHTHKNDKMVGVGWIEFLCIHTKDYLFVKVGKREEDRFSVEEKL